MFVGPLDLALGEFLAVSWSRRRIRNLRDQIGRRCLGDTVYQDAEKRDFQKDVEADSKAEEKAFAVAKPGLLLNRSETYAREVGLEL